MSDIAAMVSGCRRLLPISGGDASGLVIFCHGYGSNGDDLIAIGSQLRTVFPDIAFIAPDAPEMCAGIPFGRQWFNIEYPLSEELCRLGAARASGVLSSFIFHEAEHYGVGLDRVVLFGFSQGAMMSLYTGLRLSDCVGGILGYSGFLPGLAILGSEICSRPPILLVHGSVDDVVPVSACEQTSQGLTSLDIEHRMVLRSGLGHGIDGVGLSAGVDFLRESVGF